jgi:hypothetical protein
VIAEYWGLELFCLNGQSMYVRDAEHATVLATHHPNFWLPLRRKTARGTLGRACAGELLRITTGKTDREWGRDKNRITGFDELLLASFCQDRGAGRHWLAIGITKMEAFIHGEEEG